MQGTGESRLDRQGVDRRTMAPVSAGAVKSEAGSRSTSDVPLAPDGDRVAAAFDAANGCLDPPEPPPISGRTGNDGRPRGGATGGWSSSAAVAGVTEPDAEAVPRNSSALARASVTHCSTAAMAPVNHVPKVDSPVSPPARRMTAGEPVPSLRTNVGAAPVAGGDPAVPPLVAGRANHGRADRGPLARDVEENGARVVVRRRIGPAGGRTAAEAADGEPGRRPAGAGHPRCLDGR